ncbi:class I SAM-dependent methyltransferase [Microbacterium sp. H83]|uniref:class I SAM-dependent methyltransferase n=1 Tax=Microbacterium sp. H83 TaxID=1827324 RepID=UPI0007F357B1|nr:methyltransferase [Microbacterium sp. H83]OAN42638.1 SAM-dependent methyltransferase [Microbacterium sp. H83]
MDFPFSRLRRWPDVEAENLQAHDVTDLLLVERALAVHAGGGARGAEIAVIGDEYGAITLALTAAGLGGVRVHQDLVTGRRALARNASELALSGFVPHELDASLLSDARLVLLQLPKSLAELEEITDAVARWAASDVVLLAGGRVKHMTLAQNEVLGRGFARVQAERAVRKSRLVVASDPRDVPAIRPFPVSADHDGLTLVAQGGAFAGAKLDIGTRVLLEVLGLGRSQIRKNGCESGETGSAASDSCHRSGVVNDAAVQTVVDLGCGTGALAASYALAHPEARVIATDRSAAAVASARATVAANGVADRVTVTLDDAGSDLPDGIADVVLLNPPFHLGTSVHTGAATRLFEAAARLLRPGGELFTVYNSSLGYRAELTRLVGPTEQLDRTPKFTVARSVRR